MLYSKLNLLFFLLPLLLLLLQTPSVVLCKPQVPCFFIFGNSLVDNGNNLNLNTTAKVNFLPYGIDFPEGPTGRFSNGRNMADHIGVVSAALLGFDKYIPPFVNATDDELIIGVNYGSGGAGILEETGVQYGDILTLNEQLANHKKAIPRIVKFLGGKNEAKEHLSKCIYAVELGNNDFLTNYIPKYYASQSPYTPEQFASLVIKQYTKQLRKLYSLGARKLAVFAVGKLGCTPQQIRTYGATNGSDCYEPSNEIVKVYNEKLKLLLDRLNKNFVDASFVFTDHVSPTHGTVTNLTGQCCEQPCYPGTVPCSNRDVYYFWDEYHPTDAGSYLAGKFAYDNMYPLYADSLAMFGDQTGMSNDA